MHAPQSRSQTLSLGILETGTTLSELYDRHGHYTDWFSRFLSEASDDLRFIRYRVCEDVLPETIDDCDAYLITGSPASVLDDDSWITDLADFTKAAAASKPVIGVCFGHQLLHQAFGGRVEKAAAGWGVGVHEYDVHDNDTGRNCAWMAPRLQRFRLLTSHQDQVVTPAPGARVLASSDFCPVALSTIGDNIFTVQAHPEMTKTFCQELYQLRRERLGEERADQALASLTTETDDQVLGKWIVNFIAAS